MYEAKGQLKYFIEEGKHKVILTVQYDLVMYYLSLIPKYWNVTRPGYAPHITVCRVGVDRPTNFNVWGKFQNEVVNFCYSPELHFEPHAVWLNAYSRRLEEIRDGLGLPLRSNNPVPPFKKRFHITIGKPND